MRSICVYCGSSFGNDPIYRDAATRLGKEIATDGLTTVYGGGKIGLMGVLAESVLMHGGKITGVIPEFLLSKELGHTGLTQMIVVDDMHQRKKRMHDEADAFIALPGGFGTFEEIFEMISWGQLQLHSKPCVFMNVGGYYDHLRNFLLNAAQNGFIDPKSIDIILFEDDICKIMEHIKNYKHRSYDKVLAALLETQREEGEVSRRDL